jgi:hypothetical protein
MSRLFALAKRAPIAAAGLSLGCKYGLADVLTQQGILLSDGDEQTKGHDTRRSLMFFSFGLFYGSFVNYNVFKLYTLIPGTNAVLMTFLDCCVHLPGSFVPAFYCTQQVISDIEHFNDDGFLQSSVATGLARYQTNFFEDIKNLWMVWVPVNLVCFSVIPFHLRTPFISLFGFAYPCILSFTRGGGAAADKKID